MHKYLHELPEAYPQREEDAKELFPYKQMTAEEYAAREGHRWACFSFGEYRYSDTDLNEWIHTLDDIFFTPGELRRIQEKILSTQELDEIRNETEGPF
jgi:hypothetical protein